MSLRQRQEVQEVLRLTQVVMRIQPRAKKKTAKRS
jgi:hypothetical protein